MEIDGEVAFIDYKMKESSNRIYLIHTEVPIAIRSQGIAEKIVISALMDVKAHGWSLMPLCPYIVTYIKRHKEWLDIVDETKKKEFL